MIKIFKLKDENYGFKYVAIKYVSFCTLEYYAADSLNELSGDTSQMYDTMNFSNLKVYYNQIEKIKDFSELRELYPEDFI